MVGVASPQFTGVFAPLRLRTIRDSPAGSHVYAAAGILWMAVAMLATFLPASRASRVNPLVALRSE